MKFISKSVRQTKKIAADLAHKIIKTKKGAVIALEGELGAGKTVFVKDFAKALGIKSKIKSPTFNLMKKYEIFPSGKTQSTKTKLQTNSKFLIHLDCYRVRNYRDLETLDLKSLFNSQENIILIEWAERVREILPKKHITVHIDHISRNERKIQITKSK